MAEEKDFAGSRYLLTAAGVIVVLAGLKAGQPLLVPLVLSVFLAVLAAPLVLWMQRHRVPTIVSVPLVVLGVVAVLAAVGGFVGSSVNAFVAALPRYQTGLEDVVGGGARWLTAHGIDLSSRRMRTLFKPSAVVSVIGGTLTQLAAALSNALLVILTMAFILFEVTALPRKIRTAMGDPEADLSRFSKVTTEVQNYIVIKTYVSAATGFLVWLLLVILGVDFAALWGLIAFLLNYVPNLGSIIAAVPPVLLATVQFGFGRAMIVAAGFFAINMMIGNVVEPNLLGRRLGLSTLVVFLSLIFWGWLWGPAGMLLSVPLTMVVKIFLEHNPEWRWVAILMDPAVELEPSMVSRSRPPPPRSEPPPSRSEPPPSRSEPPPSAD